MLFGELSKWSEEGENPALRKMIYLQMAHNMSEKDFVQLRNLFIKIDKNNDGTITSNELREYFKMNQNSLALKHHSVNLGTI
jgi:Ca2+-binding EF-hand superfamily protein|tara:strand:+ start:361 stop:606 length:246 start_codon:yes stop_codon:yes gene_type:complete